LDLTEDFSFFPLELNQPLFYDLDSILVFPSVGGTVYDTSYAEVRETLVEMFLEADGSESYRGERWQRANEGAPWVFVQTYTVNRTNRAAIRREDNLQFTKLNFPLTEGRSWDGHVAFDTRREIVVGGEFLDVFNGWNYRIDTVAAAITLSTGRSFENTIRVEQADVDNLIDTRIAFERYAPGVGLIERFIDARHTQCQVCCNGDTPTCLDLPWNEKAEKGFILRQTLK
jgi:hypothetical protein